jgi:hypothetical protein
VSVRNVEGTTINICVVLILISGIKTISLLFLNKLLVAVQRTKGRDISLVIPFSAVVK